MVFINTVVKTLKVQKKLLWSVHSETTKIKNLLIKIDRSDTRRSICLLYVQRCRQASDCETQTFINNEGNRRSSNLTSH